MILQPLCINSFCAVYRTNQLTEDSRNWIRPEDLDARIEEALDNPVDLYQWLDPSIKFCALESWPYEIFLEIWDADLTEQNSYFL